MRTKTNIFWLLAALLAISFAAYLRFPGLETNPPGFWQDEASTGLDAWLIWHTGHDHAGKFLPVIARSFGDYPLAGYRYLAAPVVGLFGPTIGHQRLVAAFFGTALVGGAGVIAFYAYGRGAAIGTMVAGALCPTWLHFSRYGSEAILLPAALAIGCAAFAHGNATGRHRWFWFGALSLAFSAYTYHAVKLFLPLWMVGFLWLQRPRIRALFSDGRASHVWGPALLFAVLVMPSVVVAFSAGGLARGRTVLAWQFHPGWGSLRVVLNNYLSYFDPGMLFVRGGPAVAQAIPGLGMWNLIELPLMIAGLFVAFRGETTRRVSWFLLFWFLLGPLPGGVTIETQNMGRAIAWLPVPQIFSGLGTAAIATWSWRRARALDLDTFSRSTGAVTGALLIVGWIATAATVYWATIIRYPQIAERDFQFEVSRSLLCARDKRTDETIVISPGFQLGSVFAGYLYGDLDRAHPRGKIWTVGQRHIVAPNELYVLPGGGPVPEGREVCRIMHRLTGKAVAFVYGAAKKPRTAPGPAPVPAP